MISQLAVRPAGVQRPGKLLLPAGKSTTAGPEAVELAASAGLVLDDWQRWVLDEALAERDDGLWAAFEVALLAPRQCGKGSILEALELAGLFIFGCELVVHSAHLFKTAREHFFRMQNLIRGTPELSEQVEYIHTGSGAESIKLRNGNRLNFVARSGASIRGFSGDLVVLDEAFRLPGEAVGAMIPTLSARPNPQVWYVSSAPHADSTVLHGVRKRGMTSAPGRMFYAEWGNDPGVDGLDWDAIARANPALGIRISHEHIEAEYETLRELGDEFTRERLGVPSTPDLSAGVFPPGQWATLGDAGSKIVGDPTFSIDVGYKMAWATIGVAGVNAAGQVHVEVADRRAGTSWIPEAAQALHKLWDRPFHVDGRGPVAGILEDLAKLEVPTVELAAADLPKACAALQEKVLAGALRHLNQRPLNDAAASAEIRPAGDTWRWSRSGSPVDISPLVAVTVALWAVSNDDAIPDPVANVW